MEWSDRVGPVQVVNTRGRETEHAAMDQLEGSMHEPSQGLAYDTPMESLDDLVMVTEGGLDNWDYGNRHSPLSPAHGGAPELMMELKPLDLDLATGSTPDSISGLEATVISSHCLHCLGIDGMGFSRTSNG